jgi:hypothetical protein
VVEGSYFWACSGSELEATMIHCDNMSCIKLSENPVFHDCSKHIISGITSSRLCTDWSHRA